MMVKIGKLSKLNLILVSFVVLLLLFMGLKSLVDKKKHSREMEATYSSVFSEYSASLQELRKNNIYGALNILNSVNLNQLDAKEESHIDLDLAINTLKRDLNNLVSYSYLKEAYTKLTEHQLISLRRKETTLLPAYLINPVADSLFRIKLLDSLVIYDRYILEIAKHKEEEQREEVKKQIESRKEYGKALRNVFLDEGYDIKVRVSGTNSTVLTLTYPLFNDVWVRRFQTGGSVRSWFNLGFTRINFTDGYEYSVYLSEE